MPECEGSAAPLASSVIVDSSGFSGNLSVDDDTVQKALEKIDLMELGEGGGSTPTSFLDLTDTPATYSEQGGKLLAVKSDASGVEFVEASSSGDFNKYHYMMGIEY
jgi:hypothetical protein